MAKSSKPETKQETTKPIETADQSGDSSAATPAAPAVPEPTAATPPIDQPPLDPPATETAATEPTAVPEPAAAAPVSGSKVDQILADIDSALQAGAKMVQIDENDQAVIDAVMAGLDEAKARCVVFQSGATQSVIR